MRKSSIVLLAGAAAAFAIAPTGLAGPPGTFSYEEHGRAVAQKGMSLAVDEGKSVVVQTHVLEPGFRAPWHEHPGSSWVLMQRGTLTVWFSCTDRQTWEAGKAYFNPPREMAMNEGSEPVELVVIYVNVPADQPAGVLPASPAVPPANCAL